jgi:hypothetical protein
MTPLRLAVVRVALAFLLVAAVLYLVFGTKPWAFENIDTVRDFAAAYSWWAALLNLVPLGLLLWTAPQWLRDAPARTGVAPAVRPRGFWWVVGGAMVVFAVLAAVRLPTSLWDDEDYSVRRAVLGTYRIKDDTVRLKEVPWSHTLWFYTKPTNHIFQSALSRVSHSIWCALVRPKGLPMNEIALRLPSYLSGILALAAIALLLAEIGLPWEGALTACLLALHPWFLRLAPEARGYGMVFLLLPVVCFCGIRAANDGRWCWWVALAVAELLLMLTWPPALMSLLVINAMLILRLLTDDGLRAARTVLAGRWFVASLCAGMAFLQVFLPCVPQFREYMKGNHNGFVVDFWLRNVASLMTTGAAWSKTGQMTPPYPETWPLAAAHPGFYGIAAVGAGLLFGLGLAVFWRRSLRGRFLLAVFLLPAPVMVLMAALQDTYLFEWYVAFMLPGLAALIASGTLAAVAWTHRPSVRVAASVVVLVVFFGVTAQGRNFLLTHPAQPLRESVLLTRPTVDPNDPRNREILTISTLALPQVYDPRVQKIDSLEAMRKILEEADRRGVPLFANNGFPRALPAKNPAIAAILNDPQIFEPVAELFAIEEMLDRIVHRYRSGSVGEADWECYRNAKPSERPYGMPFSY